MTNDEAMFTLLLLFSTAVDLGEDQVQFLGFLPQRLGLFAQLRDGSNDHSDEEFGFRDSRLQIEILFRKSFFDTASSASQ